MKRARSWPTTSKFVDSYTIRSWLEDTSAGQTKEKGKASGLALLEKGIPKNS
jgi:hypothetical protein